MGKGVETDECVTPWCSHAFDHVPRTRTARHLQQIIVTPRENPSLVSFGFEAAPDHDDSIPRTVIGQPRRTEASKSLSRLSPETTLLLQISRSDRRQLVGKWNASKETSHRSPLVLNTGHRDHSRRAQNYVNRGRSNSCDALSVSPYAREAGAAILPDLRLPDNATPGAFFRSNDQRDASMLWLAS